MTDNKYQRSKILLILQSNVGMNEFYGLSCHYWFEDTLILFVYLVLCLVGVCQCLDCNHAYI